MASKMAMALVRTRLAPVSALAVRITRPQPQALFTTSSPAAATARVLGPAAGLPQKRLLYDTHMPTSPTQKILVSVASALSVFADPERGDMLAALGDVTGACQDLYWGVVMRLTNCGLFD